MQFNIASGLFRYIIGGCVLVLVFAAGVYAYLGSFSRYGGDDYCEAARVRNSSPLGAVLERYFGKDWPRATMRYSNLLFVGFSESLGQYAVQITIPFMVVLWFVACIWAAHELRRFLLFRWSILVDLFLGLLYGFFCLRQAPTLLETVYWRSGMMTHFAPLVFGLLLFAFVIRQARKAEEKPLSLWIYAVIFSLSFVIAGFSEPPTTTLLTIMPLLMLASLFWSKSPAKQTHLALMLCVFAGGLLGLLVMLLSPATAEAAQEKTLDVVRLLANSFLYSYQFAADFFKTRPLPIFLSMLIFFVLAWLYQQSVSTKLSRQQIYRCMIAMAVIPLLIWVVIAAGFSPSVYGQSFPVARMRFLASSIVIAAVLLEGALLGVLLAQTQQQTGSALSQSVALIVLAVVGIGYPLRTAINIIQSDVPAFRNRAEQWDARDTQIRAMKEAGLRDLRVPFLSTEILQDLGDRREFRLNRCASVLYGVDSILAKSGSKK